MPADPVFVIPSQGTLLNLAEVCYMDYINTRKELVVRLKQNETMHYPMEPESYEVFKEFVIELTQGDRRNG